MGVPAWMPCPQCDKAMVSSRRACHHCDARDTAGDRRREALVWALLVIVAIVAAGRFPGLHPVRGMGSHRNAAPSVEVRR